MPRKIELVKGDFSALPIKNFSSVQKWNQSKLLFLFFTHWSEHCFKVHFHGLNWISWNRIASLKELITYKLQPNLLFSSRYDVSKCTETFVILLQSITNRFKHLNDECQLKFVELQSDLLEDMRLRFAQVVRQEQTFPLTEKYCLILNS